MLEKLEAWLGLHIHHSTGKHVSAAISEIDREAFQNHQRFNVENRFQKYHHWIKGRAVVWRKLQVSVVDEPMEMEESEILAE